MCICVEPGDDEPCSVYGGTQFCQYMDGKMWGEVVRDEADKRCEEHIQEVERDCLGLHAFNLQYA